MVDTIRAWTKIYISNTDLKENWWSHCRRGDKDFYYIHNNTIRIIYFWGLLVVETSLPKIIYGDNAHMFSPNDLPCVNDYISAVVTSVAPNASEFCPLFEDFRVTRIDYYLDYSLPSEKHISELLKMCRRLYIPYMKEKEYKTSVYYYNGSRVLKMYDKNEEIKSRDDTLSYFPYLRLEYGFRKQKINRFSDEKTVKNLVTLNCWANAINEAIDLLKLNTKFTNKICLFNRLDGDFKNTRERNNLKNFIMSIHRLGERETRNKNQQFFSRSCNKLKSAQLPLNYVDEDFLVGFDERKYRMPLKRASEK